MAVANPEDASQPLPSERPLVVAIGLAAILLGAIVWAYTHFIQTADTPQRPRPVWLGVPKVVAQMADGRMVNVKVNLSLDAAPSVSELEDHVPAFKALIQEVGTQTEREALQDRAGMQRFSAAIQDAINGYLDGQQAQGRVKSVAFEDLTLLP